MGFLSACRLSPYVMAAAAFIGLSATALAADPSEGSVMRPMIDQKATAACGSMISIAGAMGQRGENVVEVSNLGDMRLIKFAGGERWDVIWTRPGDEGGCLVAWGKYVPEEPPDAGM